MITMLYWFLWVYLATLTSAYPGGAPDGSCGHMTPAHGSPASNLNQSPFYLNVSATSYLPGEKITVTVLSSGANFKGMFLQARGEDSPNNAIGWWEKPNGTSFKQMKCAGNKNSALTHTDGMPKAAQSRFVWIAPCNSTTDYRFYATIVQEYARFYVKIPSDTVVRGSGERVCKPPGSGGTDVSLPPLSVTLFVAIVHAVALLR
ncbi:putative defense protein 3 [Ciona intestinalis]